MHKQSEKTLEEVPLQSAEIQEPMDLNIDYKIPKSLIYRPIIFR
jgi:hypothetical protein